MPVLGVLTCEILELEFAHLLGTDPDVGAVTIVENVFSLGLIETLESQYSKIPGRIPLIKGFSPAPSNRLEVLVRVLELSLHTRKRRLQEGLTAAAREMGRYVDAILLGYGLCGNALEHPEELLADAGAPIFIPMDEDHPVDDCVGLIIGGRDCYYGEQCKVAGTFFMIPGWTRHWKRIFEIEHGSFDIEFTKRIFGMSNYERSLIIPNATLSEEKMKQNIEEFNRLFGFTTEVRTGTLAILQNSWRQAKSFVCEQAGER